MSVSLDPCGRDNAAPRPIQRASPRPSAAELSTSGPHHQWREVTELWLQWNEAYEQVAEMIYGCNGPNLRQLEDFMDRMDQVRERAIQLSRELLGSR